MKLQQRARTRTRLTTSRVLRIAASFCLFLAFMLVAVINVSDFRYARAAASGDYRSKASGNWSSTSTWEKYNGTSWVAAMASPSSADGVIEIISGHVVAVNANVTVDQLLVDAGAELDVNSGITLTVANGTGTDIDCSGILKKTGTITVNAGAALSFNNNSIYKEDVNGGAIPSATWNTGSTIEVTGVTTTPPSNLGQSFYNFKWNNAAQSSAINLAGGLTTINGDFTVTSTGSSSLDLSDAANTIITVIGNYVQTAGTVRGNIGNGKKTNLALYGNFTHTGGIITVGGSSGTIFEIDFNKTGTQTFTASGNTISGNVDFVVTATSTLDMGTSILTGRSFTQTGTGTINVGSPSGITSSGSTGNVQVTGTRSFSTTGTYNFNGTTAQVTGNGLPSTIAGLTINNTAGLTLSAGVTVSGTLTMTSGVITTGAYELSVSNTSTTAITGHSPSSYVNGYLRRSVNTSGAYDFPVGNTSNYELANLNLSSITGFTSIVASFNHATPIDQVLYPLIGVFVNGTPIEDMLNYGYWTMTPNSLMTGGTYAVTLKETGHTNPSSNPMSYAVIKRSSELAAWQSLGTHSNNTQSEAAGTATAVRSGLTSFSNFGIGKGNGSLPITLISFDAKPSGDNIKLSWVTGNEINNDFFTIEHSKDGKDFTPILRKTGAGNSTTTLHYTINDENPVDGINYYRLKQTDYDGKFTYSEVKKVRFEKGLSKEALNIESIGPNPFHERFSVSYSSDEGGTVNVMLMSSAGTLIKKETMQAEKGLNSYEFIDDINLQTGIYYVTISMNDNAVTKKLIKS